MSASKAYPAGPLQAGIGEHEDRVAQGTLTFNS